MKNCDFSRSDLAAAHGRHGKKLRLNLERAQGELDRREAILQRSPSGTGYDAAWAGFMDDSLLLKMLKKRCGRTVSTFQGKRDSTPDASAPRRATASPYAPVEAESVPG